MAGTLNLITGRSQMADVKYNFGASSLSAKCQLSRFDMRAVTPEIDQTTFCNETNGSSAPGTTILIPTFAGILFDGIDGSNAAAIAPQMLTNPFNIPSVYQFFTGDTITGNYNYSDFTASRIAGANSVFAGTGRSQGTQTIAWVIT